jgi:hypothetical protein
METIDELKAAWNSHADRYNQWEELGLDEIIRFAQERMRDRCADICLALSANYKTGDIALNVLNNAESRIRDIE